MFYPARKMGITLEEAKKESFLCYGDSLIIHQISSGSYGDSSLIYYDWYLDLSQLDVSGCLKKTSAFDSPIITSSGSVTVNYCSLLGSEEKKWLDAIAELGIFVSFPDAVGVYQVIIPKKGGYKRIPVAYKRLGKICLYTGLDDIVQKLDGDLRVENEYSSDSISTLDELRNCIINNKNF